MSTDDQIWPPLEICGLNTLRNRCCSTVPCFVRLFKLKILFGYFIKGKRCVNPLTGSGQTGSIRGKK